MQRFYLTPLNNMKKLSIALLLLLATLSSCVDNGVEDNSSNSKPAAMDPGKGYTERTYGVNRCGKDGGSVSLRFYDDMPNVPYIAASAYYSMMMPNATMSVVNKGDCYLLMTADATAKVDVVNDVMTSERYSDLINLMSLIAPGLPSFETCFNPFLRYDSHQYEPENATVTLNFRKYKIDLRDDGRDTYFPFATINDIFTDVSMHIACFNGKNIIVNDDMEMYDLKEIDPDYAAPAYATEIAGKDMTDFRYAELCFVIDNLYGYPGRNKLEKQGLRELGLDATLNAVSGGKEVKQLLQSENQAEFVWGFDALQNLMDDGGHTGMTLSTNAPASVMVEFLNRYNDAFSSIPDEVTRLVKNQMQSSSMRRNRRAELTAIRNKSYGSNQYVKSQNGETAVFVMNSFMALNSEGWKKYYSSNHTAEDWQKLIDDKKKDLVVQTVETLKRAKREGVKNLVLDVSINGGGEDDPTTAIVALLGDKTGKQKQRRKAYSWDMNMLTRQYLTKAFLVDCNFDGKFDELDDQQDWVEDLNIVVLTSDATFSNGSVFAAKMKDYGYPIWGQQSGGGSCSIQEMVTPDGIGFRISSYRSHSTDRNKKSIDGGTPVDRPLTDEQLYDIEYLNTLFR